MKFYKYINENSIEKTFIRIGPGSGQKQTHKTLKMAPEKKGIWLLPIKGTSDLAFLGGGSGYLKHPRTTPLKKDKDEYEKIERELEKLFKTQSSSMEKIETLIKKQEELEKKRIKLNYKTFKLKPKEKIWCHIGKGIPTKVIDGWEWYKVSVSEYWKLYKRAYAKSVGGEIRSGKMFLSPDWEWFEVFYPTT